MLYPVTCSLLIDRLSNLAIVNLDPQLDVKPKFKKQVDFEEPTFHEHH